MNDYRAALKDVTIVIRAHRPARRLARRGLRRGGRFILVDGQIAGFEKFPIKPGKPKTIEAYIYTITKQIGNGGKQAQSIADGYEPVFPYRRPRWTIASYVRQGQGLRDLRALDPEHPGRHALDLKKVPPPSRPRRA